MKIALANPATSLAAPHAVAGGASSVDHEASILTSVRKYQERRGIDWLTPKMLVEQQEEIKEEGIDPMRIEDNSTSVLVKTMIGSRLAWHTIFREWHSKIH